MAGLLAHEAKDLEGPLVMASGISLAHRLPFTPVQPFTQVSVQEKLPIPSQFTAALLLPLNFFFVLFFFLSKGYSCSFSLFTASFFFLNGNRVQLEEERFQCNKICT